MKDPAGGEPMRRILDFMRLDLYTLKSLRYVLIIVVPIIFIFTLQGTTILMMITVTLSACPFQLAELNHLDMLYATLPLTRRDIVRGRYTTTLAGFTLLGILTLIPALLVKQIVPLEATTTGLISNTVSGFFGFCLFAAVQNPFFFKFSYLKARILSVLAWAVVLLPLTLGLSMITPAINANPAVAAVLAVISGLVLMGVSYEISYAIYSKQDL